MKTSEKLEKLLNKYVNCECRTHTIKCDICQKISLIIGLIITLLDDIFEVETP